MTADRHTIAAYVPVRNCPELLAECLGHLSWVDEIVVADASTDDRIARMLAARFPRVKRYVDCTPDHRTRLCNTVPHIASEFILGIDADEFFTPEAGEEILGALKRPCPYDGFRVPSISYVFGHCLGAGATQLKLYRKDRFRWLMQSMHEMVFVDGPVGVLTQPFHHHNSPSLSMMPIKAFRYEAAQAALLDDAELERLALDNKPTLGLWRSIAVEWLRLNVRFLRAAWGNRHLGFAGLCLAYAQAFHVMAHHVCITEERRMRAGVITRDRHGYL
jgi:glycosyltransferase involved in cell wall biosynthesis